VTRVLIVPAAGSGTRLASPLPKLLVAVVGKPMIDHVLDRHRATADAVMVVVSPQAEEAVRRHLAGRHGMEVLVQPTPTGMLDAMLIPRHRLEQLKPREVWISWCDQVGIQGDTVRRLAAAMAAEPAPALAFPTVIRRDPYIHFSRGADGRMHTVLQRREGDAMPAAGEGDIGLFALAGATYLESLTSWAASAPRGASSGERNFLPFIPWLAQQGSVVTIPASDPMEAVGINTPAELERVANYLRPPHPAGP
jgi:bifunctional UDP-N-acetylglucosamine pyrophosphorylase/glucosamine-1-phosphate N-acetyltransferase